MKSFFFSKEKLPPKPKNIELLQSLIGGFVSILFLIGFSQLIHYTFIMAPFGASCVILFAVSQSPLAQPRNVIFGHLIAAFVGLVFLKLFGSNVIIAALAVGIAIVSMQYFRAVHPPAGANPLVILLTADKIDYDFSFLLFPVLSGSVILVMIAYLVNNLFNKTHWPIYWLALFNRKKES
ncbi:HPP family protein [Gilliamella apicola]|uniref:HPP family protein n=2 Tax=Gilliamella apicola TaxID=1196095 RepID=UPI000A34C8A0|nr:HPP family protein [Gilliamella apicola]OTP88887.1 HPP family protein [Gilliamella apicola]OTP94551.1 HPP family protein [Gilliamella apicola]OTP94982.1 HPP family protein [Gilliamella apicola]OTP98558.1 HPP family protein [Gilliamella apicola]OTQ14745.1 HPP family protein [Gilliamella apicola]